jgi:hypothetical protein
MGQLKVVEKNEEEKPLHACMGKIRAIEKELNMVR